MCRIRAISAVSTIVIDAARRSEVVAVAVSTDSSAYATRKWPLRTFSNRERHDSVYFPVAYSRFTSYILGLMENLPLDIIYYIDMVRKQI